MVGLRAHRVYGSTIGPRLLSFKFSHFAGSEFEMKNFTNPGLAQSSGLHFQGLSYRGRQGWEGLEIR